MNTDSKISIVGVWERVGGKGSKMTILRCLDTLEGTFVRKHIEPKLFGMHIGSVLSGLGIRNVNTDLKMLSLPVFWGRK